MNWKKSFIYFISRRVSSFQTGPEIFLHRGLSSAERIQGGPVPDCGQADPGVPVQQEEEGGEVSAGERHSASGNLSDLLFPHPYERNYL